jgi:peptidoglycan hydrolase-like protein with peptidoglycan-binding domain
MALFKAFVVLALACIVSAQNPGGCNWPVIYEGHAGEDVVSLQYLLNYHGQTPPLTVSGVFDTDTKNSVIAFQTANDIGADGIVGPVTWISLIVLTRVDDKGEQVEAIQSQLHHRYGYSLVAVDAIFGPSTQGAVMDFQKHRYLNADGVVGSETWRYLIAQCMNWPNASYGIDQSHFTGTVSVEDYQCLIGTGYSFAFFQAQNSNGAYSAYVASQAKNARTAGFKNIDVYMSLMFTTADPHCSQVNKTLDSLANDGVKFNRVWFDIEGTHSTNQAFGCAFIQSCRANVEAAGHPVGVYCTASEWNTYMGPKCTQLSDSPYWYAHFDEDPSFYDFVPFGGWTSADVKQFVGNDALCGTTFDINFAPFLFQE